MNHIEYLFRNKPEAEITEEKLFGKNKIDQAKMICDMWWVSASLNSRSTITDRIRVNLYYDIRNYDFFSGFNQEHIEKFPQYCGSAYKIFMVICADVYDSRLSKYVDPGVWGRAIGISGVNTALNIYGILAGGLRQNFGTS